jgi:hypothetical protein
MCVATRPLVVPCAAAMPVQASGRNLEDDLAAGALGRPRQVRGEVLLADATSAAEPEPDA